MSRIDLGRHGETLAAEHLEGLGYSIIARNHRSPLGELDLIGRDGPCWVFVEVKTRRSLRCGSGAEAVTSRKQERLVRLGQHYLSQHGLGNQPFRFDVVDVRLLPGDAPIIRHIKGAFGGG